MNLKDVSVHAAINNQIEACHAIFMDSILGHYFGSELAMSVLKTSINNGELFVAIVNDEIIGFYHVAKTGAFLAFPYLHLLAVKSSVRSKGVGALLLKHFEQMQLESKGFPHRLKTFLLVSAENTKAISFYKRNGYIDQASFDNMFAEGDTEILMMKDLGLKNI